jgi:hypothetical protein
MCGSTLSLENRSLSIIISQMVMPETEIEWISTFKKEAVFPVRLFDPGIMLYQIFFFHLPLLMYRNIYI